MGTRLIDRAERLEAIERLLFRNALGLRAVEIADTCGVDRRTIYRDLSLLMDIGVPIHQKDGRFFINREQYAPLLRFTLNEIMALCLSLRQFIMQAEQHDPHAIAALGKLTAALPEVPSTQFNAFLTTARKAPIDRSYIVILETLTLAWTERRRVKLWHSTAEGETVEREFALYFIEPTVSGGLYAVGFDIGARRVRAIALRRIKRVTLLKPTYEIPAQFDPTQYAASAWGSVHDETGDEKTRIILAFSPTVMPLLRERPLHPTQRIEIREDQRCIVTLHVIDWRPMLPWLRSWGTQVEVLQPDALRREIAAESVQVAALYFQREKPE